MERKNASDRLKELFSEAFVKNDPETLSKYSSSISGTSLEPLCIVYPTSVAEVQKLVSSCPELGIRLYPISRGKNLGYGEAQGSGPGQVIVDLSKMNRIIHVDAKMATATLEPGVSQHQMYKFLRDNHPALQTDVTGAGLDASITGNILERGFGHTDYGDRWSRVINMKIVTPDGELLHTGMGSLENADAQNVYRYGIGPTIDGLFTQSGMGIIVEITIELMPAPECVEMFVFSTRDENDAGKLTEVIRNLKLNGVVNSAVHIANRSRAIGDKANRFAGAWNLSGVITGTPGMVRGKRRAVKKEFRKYINRYKLHFLGKRSMSLVKWIHENIKPVPVYDALRDAFDLITGVPTDHPLKTLLNDDALTSEQIDTRHYKTCFSWINAVCQCREESINELLGLISSEFTEHGYEFRVTFTAVNPRTLIMISNISYPRNESEIQKAEKFLIRCQKKLADNGFYPYRSGSGIHEKTPQHAPAYMEFLKKIKGTIDPHGIIAPGKYNL